jgi:hypothetical protein
MIQINAAAMATWADGSSCLYAPSTAWTSFVIGHALQVFSGIRLSVPAFMMSPEWSVNRAGALDWRRPMRNIVDEAGEIIAKSTDDHTLVGGHHRLAVAASLGKKLFWKDTGEPVKLDPFFKGSSHRHIG